MAQQYSKRQDETRIRSEEQSTTGSCSTTNNNNIICK